MRAPREETSRAPKGDRDPPEAAEEEEEFLEEVPESPGPPGHTKEQDEAEVRCLPLLAEAGPPSPLLGPSCRICLVLYMVFMPKSRVLHLESQLWNPRVRVEEKIFSVEGPPWTLQP